MHIRVSLMEWVDSNVAIGSWRDADDRNDLREQGIDLIIDARILFDDSKGRDRRTPRLEHMSKVVDLLLDITQKGGKVLIRCYHGRDRSPFVAMLYLSRKENISYHHAYDKVKAARPRTVEHWDWMTLLEGKYPSPPELP